MMIISPPGTVNTVFILITAFLLLMLLSEQRFDAAPSPGRPHRTDYDESLARRLLNLSAGAYALSPDECVRGAFPAKHNWTLWTSTTEGCDSAGNLCSFYAIVVENMREIVVVFRGTKTKRQLFLEGWQSLQPGADFFGVGKVNKYFFKAHSTLWNNLEPLLKDARYKSYSITFTGHSLGGALASLAAMRTVMDDLRASNSVLLYTFGQPRVGCSKFAFKHDELVPKSYRVVHRMDVVPHLPRCAKDRTDARVPPGGDSMPCDAEAVGVAYHHGTEIWYPYGMNEADSYYECLGTPKNEDFECSDSLSFGLSKYETYVSDHRHYFNHKVPSFGKLGCRWNVTKKQEDAIPNDAVDATVSTSTPCSTETEGGNGCGKFVQIVQKLGKLLWG